ncbi:hypothetical protein B0O80DRAFT_533487 [Mortierella sp. GBAus27b]|nr:hypothetical protein B0O80DRAFT_533487 [Mortierella sp. GBAus27b]
MGPIHSSTKHLMFLGVSYGSGLKGIQAILSGGEGQGLVPRTSFESDRTLVTSLGEEQTFELQAFDMKLVGICDGVIYPFRITPLGINTHLHPVFPVDFIDSTQNTSGRMDACIIIVVGSFLFLNTIPGTIDKRRKE